MATLWEVVQEELNHFGKRMRGLAMISRGIVPNLVISQRVVDRVVEAARHFLADETGETMVGMVIPPDNTPEAMPTLYVLDTIAPDESVIRRSHMFEQGDDLQGDIFVWLEENWNAYQELGKDMNGNAIKPEWKHPLRHIGDWHKQPGYMIQPSGGDLMTALRFMEDEENNFEFLLVPIVTLGHDSVTSENGLSVNYFTIPMQDGTSLRMDWWYIHRDSRFFQPITPKIVPAKELPVLTPYPWHIIEYDLLIDEMDLLEKEGIFLIGEQAIQVETDGDLPLEVCFILGWRGSSSVLLVVTNWDYPKTMPQARLAKFEGIGADMYLYDIFQKLWDTSKVVTPKPTFKWNAETFLVDFAMSIIEQENIPYTKPFPTPAQARPANSGRVNIEVEIEEKPRKPTGAKPMTSPAKSGVKASPKPTSKPAQKDDD
jgi:hypothetical protein